MLETRPSTVLQVEVEHFELTKVHLLPRHLHRRLIQHFLIALPLLRNELESRARALLNLRVVLLLSTCGLLTVCASIVCETAYASLLHALLRFASR